MYKKSKDFEYRVAESSLDAFDMGFVQCKKVTETFLGLTLDYIIGLKFK